MKRLLIEKNGINAIFGVILMVAITIIIAFFCYQYASGKIAVDVGNDGVFSFSISDTTILEIVALIIIVIAISYWINQPQSQNDFGTNIHLIRIQLYGIYYN